MAHERAGASESLNLKCSECRKTIRKSRIAKSQSDKAAVVKLNYETISGETKQMTSKPLHVKCAEELARRFAAFGHKPAALLIG